MILHLGQVLDISKFVNCSSFSKYNFTALNNSDKFYEFLFSISSYISSIFISSSNI